MNTVSETSDLMRFTYKLIADGQFDKIDRMFEILDITQSVDLDTAIILLRITHHSHVKKNLKNRQPCLMATAEQLDANDESSGRELAGLL